MAFAAAVQVGGFNAERSDLAVERADIDVQVLSCQFAVAVPVLQGLGDEQFLDGLQAHGLA